MPHAGRAGNFRRGLVLAVVGNIGRLARGRISLGVVGTRVSETRVFENAGKCYTLVSLCSGTRLLLQFVCFENGDSCVSGNAIGKQLFFEILCFRTLCFRTLCFRSVGSARQEF